MCFCPQAMHASLNIFQQEMPLVILRVEISISLSEQLCEKRSQKNKSYAAEFPYIF